MTILKNRFLHALTALLMFAATAAHGQWNPLNPVAAVQKQDDGITARLATGVLRVRVCSDSMVRITYAPGSSIPERPEYVVLKKQWAPAKWSMQSTSDEVSVATAQLKVIVQRKDSRVVF